MNNNHKLKLSVFIFCFFIATILIIGNLIKLTIIDNRKVIVTEKSVRGIIYDAKMRPLTINIPAYTIYLDKNAFTNSKNKELVKTNSQVLYTAISKLLNISKEELDKKFSLKASTVAIANNIDFETYSKLLEIKNIFNLNSIYGREDNKRFYPYGDVFAHTIGYLDTTQTKGYAGLEASYDYLLSSYSETPSDIILTLDRDVQTIVRNEVLKTVSEVAMQSATVIISDVATGAVIANYTYPSFDPNNPFIYTNGERNDRSIKSTIYPGSAMKIFAELAALETGVVSIDEEFYCKGYYEYSKQTRIHCDYPHGKIKFEDILKYSCNSAIVEISERIDKKFYYDYLKKLGFGEKTGIGNYKDEWSGIYHDLKKWSAYARGYLAIGYDLSSTPMQLASSYVPLLNGGYKIPAHIIYASIDKQNRRVVTNIYKKERIIAPQYAQISKYLLRKGVESGSTGGKANLKNIEVVGKTGTTITQGFRLDTENPQKYYQVVFIGGFPLENPKVSMLVLIDGPEGTRQSAGRLAAPLFAKIALQIIPYIGLVDNDVYMVNTNDFNSLIPSKPQELIVDTMPNLKNKSLRDALNIISPILEKHNARIVIQGEGYVQDFSPIYGTEINNGSVIKILLSPDIHSN